MRNPYESAPTISPVPTNNPTRPTSDLALGRAAVDPTAVGSTRAYIERINPVWAKVNIKSAIWRVDATASASLRAVKALMVLLFSNTGRYNSLLNLVYTLCIIKKHFKTILVANQIFWYQQG